MQDWCLCIKISLARRRTQSSYLEVLIMERSEAISLWVPCPVCGSKTRTRVYEDTVIINFPLFCPKCKTETPINVVKLKMVIHK